jgi:hypothetical protein
MDSFLKNLDYSVAVEPYLNANHFYTKEGESITSGDKKREKERTTLTPAESLRVLFV